MAVLHIPDGVLPIWLIVAGFIVAFAVLAISIRMVKRRGDVARVTPLIAIMSAFMLVVMNIPLGEYHVNLTALTGILLGPWAGYIAVFVTAIILGFIGHGGVTVSGLRALIFGLEVAVGYCVYRSTKRMVDQPSTRAGAATFSALILSVAFVLGIVAAGGIDPLNALDEPGEDNLSLPAFAAIVVPIGIIGSIVEAVVTGLVVGYLSRVRPDLLEE